MKHALVIGGSGMLAQASSWLANNGYVVSVIGRNMEKLTRLADSNPNIIPISADYYRNNEFRYEIIKSMKTYGSFEIVVAWIHSQEKEIIELVSDAIRKVSNQKWRLFHVLGSSSNLDEIVKEVDVCDNCEYHQIQLGFIVENNRSRWLSHDEISNGVIYGIRTNSKKHLVGTLTPWGMRP